MNEKYKIRVSNNTYYSLMEDMIDFEFFKPNGELNKNSFYNLVISRFYNNYIYQQEYIQDVLNEGFSNVNKNKLVNIAGNIVDKINFEKNSDLDIYYHDKNIYIQVTSETRELYRHIEENSLKNKSLSEFIRNLLNEYISKPYYIREKYIFLKQYNDICVAIKNKRRVKIHFNEGDLLFEPYKFEISTNYNRNYLVGFSIGKKRKKVQSIKLSKIKSVTILADYFSLTKDECEYLDSRLEYGPEFLSDKMSKIIIQLDDKGIRSYYLLSKGRPYCKSSNEQTGIFIFECDENYLFNYLKSFGRHVKIIEPLSLKEKLNKFHSDSIVD